MARHPLLALCLALLALLGAATGPARETSRWSPQLGAVSLAELPPEAGNTLALIRQGGPFPYRRDGIEFPNRERRLPLQPRGYYREYTVSTPGSPDRGARRIVAGRGAGKDVRTSGEYYYTGDHYRSFRRIVG
jgi:ribonuclease T1